MKFLVTGATGFVGSHVISSLMKRNINIVATSTNILKAKEKVWFNKIKYVEFDLKNFDNAIDYHKYFDNPDAVIHLAWEGLPNYNASFHIDKNLPLNFAFLKNLIEHGQRNLTISGTCLEYGLQEGCLSEEMESKPIIAYAIAKDTLRKQLQQMQLHHHFLLKWVRLFYTYGHGQNANSLLSQLSKALEMNENYFNMSGGEQVRDYLPIEKIADHIVDISIQENVSGVINCCSGKGTRLIDLVNDYLDTRKNSIRLNLGYFPYLVYEPMKFWGDPSKLNKIFI